MSKKKNTLKDLDEFLKQQAATLVSPQRLGDQVETAPQPPAPKTEAPPAPVSELKPATNGSSVSAERILDDLKQLAAKEGHLFKNQFYDLIIKSVESQREFSAEDRMLINTALYLKGGSQWKNVIRDYWKKRNS